MASRGFSRLGSGHLLWLMVGILAGVMALVLLRLVLTPVFGKAETVSSSSLAHRAVLMASDEYSNTVYLPLVAKRHAGPPLPSAFGVQMYGTLSEPANALSLARAAGVYWVRWPISWRSVEPTNTDPSWYYWSSTDASVRSAAESGQKLIITIADLPDWAADYRQGPVYPESMPDFVEFISELVERYDGDGVRDAPGSPIVESFEFFNEPDSENVDGAEAGYHSLYGPVPELYASMLCTVYPAVKAQNSKALVVFGGIALDFFVDEGGSFNPAFLDDVMDAGAGPCFDVMNFHYYPAFEQRWEPYGMGLTGKTAYVRSRLAAHGLAKPIVVTEAGWRSNQPLPTDLPGTPEIQSAYVLKLFTQAAVSRLDLLVWWSWIDVGLYWGDMGLLTDDLVPKMSHGAYGVAAARVGQGRFDSVVQSDQVLENYRFTNGAGYPMYIAWTNDGVSRAVSFPLVRAVVVDMLGNTVAYLDDGADGSTDGRVRYAIGPYPVYVEGVP